jgi:F-type H+-transporting ATPase subunit delta
MVRAAPVAEETHNNNFSSGVAGRYAYALFELARDVGAVDIVQNDLDRVSDMLASSVDFQRLINSPLFSTDEQVKAVTALLDRAGLKGLAANFIKLVAAKRRLFALPGMMRSYRAFVAQSKGIVNAEIRLAAKPSDAVMNDIKATLKSVAGGEVDTKVIIDPSIIGGIVVKIGSKMVDASLKTKLNSLRLTMKEAR